MVSSIFLNQVPYRPTFPIYPPCYISLLVYIETYVLRMQRKKTSYGNMGLWRCHWVIVQNKILEEEEEGGGGGGGERGGGGEGEEEEYKITAKPIFTILWSQSHVLLLWQQKFILKILSVSVWFHTKRCPSHYGLSHALKRRTFLIYCIHILPCALITPDY